jgi:hypothetical protein
MSVSNWARPNAAARSCKGFPRLGELAGVGTSDGEAEARGNRIVFDALDPIDGNRLLAGRRLDLHFGGRLRDDLAADLATFGTQTGAGDKLNDVGARADEHGQRGA